MTQRLTAPRSERIRLGASACLLGEEVRFDGGHKQDRFVRYKLAFHFDFIRVCPEVEIGLGTPRETIRLVAGPDGVRLVGNKSGADLSDRMRRYAAGRAEALADADLGGFIFQQGSPTCGMERVRIYRPEGGAPSRDGRGLFAEALIKRMPLMPVEEAGRLKDPRLRENFFERVFAYHRLRTFFGNPWTLGDLVAFHTREKLLLLSHHRGAYDFLGRLVAKARQTPREEIEQVYPTVFMGALQRLGSVGSHTNVLQHMAGHVKRILDDQARLSLAELIEDYRTGLVPLSVPLTLINHHIQQHRVSYLASQTYLSPHPKTLRLRNHVV